MTDALLRVLGLDDGFRENLSDVSLAFQNPLALYVGGALVVPVGLWVYLRQRANLAGAPRPVRLALTATRVIVLALLVLMLSGPYAKLELKSERKPVVAVLIDHSRSMGLDAGPFPEGEARRLARAAGYRVPDGPLDLDLRREFDRKTRLRLAQSVLVARQADFLVPLRAKYDVQVYAFGRDARPLALDLQKPEFTDAHTPTEPGSHPGTAVAFALSEAAGRPVAGIVLMSDGEATGGRPLADAARTAGQARAPLFAVPVGTSARLKDVAIVDTSTSGQVAVGDTARVGVTLESQGYDARPVQVLLKDAADGKVLDTKELTLLGREQQLVELSFKPTEAGPRHVVVEVPALPDEDLRMNNSDVGLIRVTDERLRVLHLEGPARWDYRFLRNAMQRDSGLGGRLGKTPDTVLEAEWRRLPESGRASLLPRTLDEIAQYHTIVIGDVSARMLTPALAELIDKAVRERGVGLIVQGGPLAMPHAADPKLVGLLPTVLGGGRGVFANAARPFRLELTPDGALSDAMRLHDDAGRNGNTWNGMLPFQWCVAAARLQPGAQALAVNATLENGYGKVPVVATHFAGRGRVMLVGTDSTWLWRRHVADRFFYKFWGQSLRHVARRDEVARRKSWLEVTPLRVQPGEEARLELFAVKSDGSPVTDPSVTAQVTGGGEPAAVTLTADPNAPGRFVGTFRPAKEGDYRVLAEAGGRAEARLRAQPAPEEFRYPNVNRDALRQAAAESGGKLVELHELATVPPLLKGEAAVTARSRQKTVWDNWLFLGLLVLVYSFDVGLRRLAGLS